MSADDEPTTDRPPALPEEPRLPVPRRRRRYRRAAIGASLAAVLLVAGTAGVPVARAFFPGTAPFARPPSAMHPLGTSLLGADLLVLLCQGIATSLLIAFAATLVSVALGAPIGAIAALSGRRVDQVLMRAVDFLGALPGLLLLVLVMAVAHAVADDDRAVFGRAVDPAAVLVLALGGLRALSVARVARGSLYGLRRRGFVLVARAHGVSRPRIFFRHVLPHAWGPLVVYAALGAPVVVVEEAFLSFLGLGVAEPRASLGALVREGLRAMAVHPWILLASSAALVAATLALRLCAEALRDALDPVGPKT